MRAGLCLSCSFCVTWYCAVKPVAQNKVFSRENLFRGADQNTEKLRRLFLESRKGYLNTFYPLLRLGFVAVMVFLTPLCSVLPTPTYGKILSRLLYNSVSFFQFTHLGHCPLAPKGL